MTPVFRDALLRIAFKGQGVWLKKQEIKEIGADLVDPIVGIPTEDVFGTMFIKCELTPKGALVAASY